MSNSNSILLVSGSPSAASRSASLLEKLARTLRAQGRSARVVYASDFPASELIHGNIDDKSILTFRREIAEASAVVFATPIYKATYSGLLKILVDFIPPDGLADKTVLAIATGKLDTHFALVTAAFEALFAAFRDVRSLPTIVVSDYQFLSGGQLEASAEEALARALAELGGSPGLRLVAS